MNGFCRFCQCVRNVTAAKQCEGCGMPAANAIVPNSAKKKPLLVCPNCRSRRSSEFEKDRFLCDTCGSVFEQVDQGFLDDRPEQNAMKKERVNGG